MLHIKPITARAGVRVGLMVGLGITATIIAPLLLFSIVYTLPDRYPFSLLRSDVGILAAAILSVLLIGILMVAFWWLFPEGKIVIDSSGLRWKIKGERGEIRWDAPFTVQRWQSVYVSGGYSYDQNPVSLPVIVYEITQGNTQITFWYSESLKRLEGLPSGTLYGTPLFHRARRLTQAIDYVCEVKQKRYQNRAFCHCI